LNRFAGSENLDENAGISRVWESIKREYNNFSNTESKLLIG